MKWIATLLLLLSVSVASAQKNKKAQEPEREVFAKAEQMPEFPGGVEALHKYLTFHVVYPKKAIDDGVEGVVVVKFVVSETGILEQIEVLAGVSKELDEEAMRVVKEMPVWLAGKQNGKPVAVSLTLPVTFEISD